MESIQELYRIGLGPSSSHTMGPRYAAEIFLQRHSEAGSFDVTLFGSLAATGRGHLTDRAISAVFEPGKLGIHWKPDEELPLHPNGMRFEAYSDTDKLLGKWEVYSMSKVYRLPAIPAWNTWRTNAVFMISALLLGQSLMAVLLPYGSDLTDSLILILLLAQLSLMHKSFSRYPFHHIRIGLILAGMILTVTSFFPGGAAYVWLSMLILLTVVAEEGIGKWSFYQVAHDSFSSYENVILSRRRRIPPLRGGDPSRSLS